LRAVTGARVHRVELEADLRTTVLRVLQRESMCAWVRGTRSCFGVGEVSKRRERDGAHLVADCSGSSTGSSTRVSGALRAVPSDRSTGPAPLLPIETPQPLPSALFDGCPRPVDSLNGPSV